MRSCKAIIYKIVVALLIFISSGNGLVIQNARLGAGTERGLLLVTLSNGDSGSVCMLNDTKVGEAVCTYLLGKSNSTAVDLRFFTGTTSQPVKAAISGCSGYDPEQTGRWDLNNDCRVITGPAIPAVCSDRLLQVTCELVELSNGSATPPPPGSISEGLVLVGLTGRLGTVCASGAGMNEAAAICRSLGYANPERAYPITGRYKPNPANPNENTTVEQLKCRPGDRLINCNWQTVSTASCYDASNQLAVACNPVPPTPKPMPSPSLMCYRQEANICFSRNSISRSSELQLLYNSTTVSGCVLTDYLTPTQVCLKVQNYSACATVSGQTEQYTQYHLLMRFLGEKNAAGSYIRPPLDFNLYCRLAKETLATGQSLGPEFVTPTTAIDGHSGGYAVVEIYKGLSGGDFTDGPITDSVEIGTILYAAVVLRGAADLNSSWLVVNNCWATDGLHNASLVQDKCPRDSGIVLIPVNNTAMAVRFQAFLFNTSSGGISSSKIEFFCSTIICRLGDPSAQCSRQCDNFYHRSFEGRAAASLSQSSHRYERRLLALPASLSVYRPTKAASAICQPAVTIAVSLVALLSSLWNF